MTQKQFSFTKNHLSNIAPPPKNGSRIIVRDLNQKGLMLMVTYGGTKTFYFCHRYGGKKKLLKIGQFPYIDIDEAREKAFLYNKSLQNGDMPSVPKPTTAILTLQSFFDNEYIPKYAMQYKKPQTWQSNKQSFNRHFRGISNRPLNSFTKFEIDTLHKEIGTNRGTYIANRCLCLLRHIFNTAIDWGFIDSNPAVGIRAYPEKSRDRFLQPEEMTAFMNSLHGQRDVQLKQFIMLLLLTGQRKMNICSIKWADIDFHNGILYLPETKNGDPQRVPLTNQAMALLDEIKAAQTDNKSSYVFPSKRSESGHIANPKAFWDRVVKDAGLSNLRMHDLRRTMGSYQAITGSSMNVIAKSLGHKSVQSTGVYARLNLDSVRGSMQRATDEIYKISQKN